MGAEGDDMEAIEGQVVDEPRPVTALARVNGNSTALQEWTPRFAITVDQAVEMVEQKREFMRRVMREGEHYGVIPGTSGKPSLLKPGAELLLSSMGLHPRYRDSSPAVEDWSGTEHGGEPFFRYRKTCMITRQTGLGPEDYVVIAEAGGNCNSWEKKYRYRNAQRVCPECGEATIIKGKAEFGGGWLCWRRKGGCGSKFEENDVRITKQEAGQVANPDIADLSNTIEKMADKRALVAATLLATGCSDIFTQDLEDGVDVGDEGNAPGMSNGEVEHGQGAPEPAAPKTRTRTQQQASTTSAPARATSAAAQPSQDEVGKLIWLATCLPEPIPSLKDEKHVLAMLKTSPIGGLMSRIKQEHLSQCGDTCSHLLEKAS